MAMVSRLRHEASYSHLLSIRIASLTILALYPAMLSSPRKVSRSPRKRTLIAPCGMLTLSSDAIWRCS